MWCLRFWDCCSPVSLIKMLSTTFSALPPPVMKLWVITFHDPGTDLSSNPKLRPAALHRHQVVRLHDTGLDALHIQRTDGSQVDHLTQTKTGCGLASHGAHVVCVSCYKKICSSLYLTLNSLLGEDSSSIQTVTNVPRVADESDVIPWNSQKMWVRFLLHYKDITSIYSWIFDHQCFSLCCDLLKLSKARLKSFLNEWMNLMNLDKILDNAVTCWTIYAQKWQKHISLY